MFPLTSLELNYCTQTTMMQYVSEEMKNCIMKPMISQNNHQGVFVSPIYSTFLTHTQRIYICNLHTHTIWFGTPYVRTSFGSRLVKDSKPTLTASDRISTFDHIPSTTITTSIFNTPNHWNGICSTGRTGSVRNGCITADWRCCR